MKVTSNVHVASVASVVPTWQLPATAKSPGWRPPTVIDVRLVELLPRLVIVICEGDVGVPTKALPNSRYPGVAAGKDTAVKAGVNPSSVTVCGLPGALV